MLKMQTYAVENKLAEGVLSVRKEHAIEAFKRQVTSIVKDTEGIIFKGMYKDVPDQKNALEQVFKLVEDSGIGEVAYVETVEISPTQYTTRANVRIFSNAWKNQKDESRKFSTIGFNINVGIKEDYILFQEATKQELQTPVTQDAVDTDTILGTADLLCFYFGQLSMRKICGTNNTFVLQDGTILQVATIRYEGQPTEYPDAKGITFASLE